MDKGTSRRGVLASSFGQTRRHRKPHRQRQKPERSRVYSPQGPEHWVGDGFYVKTVFWPQLDAQMLSPFLLLDHAARKRFDPSPWRRGVGEHPHRGFETVTFAYEGEIEHRDSAGGGGRIGPGDVQWMTASSGIVHEEKHSQAFSERGGDFEMVQLWVNLPADKKMSEPRYQPLLDREFPRLQLGAAEARLVRGQSRRRDRACQDAHSDRDAWIFGSTKTARRSSSSPRLDDPRVSARRGRDRRAAYENRSRRGTLASSTATTTARCSCTQARARASWCSPASRSTNRWWPTGPSS